MFLETFCESTPSGLNILANSLNIVLARLTQFLYLFARLCDFLLAGG